MNSQRPGRATIAARTPVLLLAAALAACGGGGGDAGMQMPPTPVSVATVVQKRISDADEFTGRIEAINSVEIRPRVGGYLTGVHFEEGGIVSKGDLLFSIDDREYRAAVASARADVARARARGELARTELARSETLIAAKAVSAGELEARQNEARQAEADLLAAQARLEQAELNLSFTRVTAPIDGRVGAARVRAGNLVGPGEPVLTTVVTLDPVYVSFAGDERAFLRYQQAARQDIGSGDAVQGNVVRVGLANDAGFPHEGRVVFVDNALNPVTGTIHTRAELANPDGRFTPGMFARVQLLGASERDALLVHPQAVQTDQDRRFVYVAAPGEHGGLVALRKDITLGASVDGLAIVEEGLAPQDRVVVNGMRKIFFPGAPIAPVDVPMDAPNSAPADAAAPAAGTEG